MKRILCLVLSLTAAAGLMLVRDSAAWIKTSTGSALGQTINVKKVAFTFSGEIGSYLQYDTSDSSTAFILTDTNLVKKSNGAVKLSGTNASTIPTELRYKVTYTSPRTGSSVDYSGSGDLLTVTYNSSVWTYNSTDHYFYYAPNNGVMATTTTSFDLLTGLSFSDEALQTAGVTSTSNLHGGSIVVNIQARQSDNMVWADLDSIISGS